MEKIFLNIKIECIKGDIISQKDITAIVNAANPELKSGGGVAGAIHRAAGPGLEKDCISSGPISPGEAVITGAHNLHNKFVIHCLGPVYGRDKPEDKLLRECYLNALKISEEYDITSIAFPAISTGAYGYPTKAAAQVAFEAISIMIPKLKSIKKIRFVLYDEKDLKVYDKILSQL